jgi:glutamate--cysteine ligase
MLKFTCCDEIRPFLSPDNAQVLRGITRGYERECLRVDASGHLAQTPHPLTLGSKLTHPWITTDYAEALLEFITPPSAGPGLPARTSCATSTASRPGNCGEETMWASSMPCVVGDDKNIPWPTTAAPTPR